MTRVRLDVRVLEAGEQGVEDLCALFRASFQAEVTPEQWRWKYHDPALEGHLNVVLSTGDSLSGHAGAMILRGVHDGSAVPLAQVCDVMLAPDARGLAGSQSAYARLIQGLIGALRARIPMGLYFGFPGERPFRLGERLGFYRRIGPIQDLMRPIASPGFSLWRLKPLSWQDPRLDRLWQRHVSRPGCRLVRDGRYLGWRYACNPYRAYQLLGVWHAWSLAGWLVIHRQGEEVLVVDRLIDERALVPVLDVLGGWAKVEGGETLVWWRGDYQGTEPPGVVKRDTGLIGGIMPASDPCFARCMPTWQPGDTDVR